MITETKEIYKCEYCKKLYQKKHACVKHELICRINPINHRPCFSCVHLDKKDATVEGYNYNYSVSLLYCKKKEEFVYPPKTEIKKNFPDIGDSNEPMPKECDLWSNEIEF